MKSTKKWIIAALVLVVVAGVAMRVLSKRQGNAPAAPAAKAEPIIELAAGDVFTLEKLELSQGVPISGTLKAVNTAQIKARVSGELQGLSVREGDAVKAGQILARVESSEYAARVRQAEETAGAAKAQMDIAQRAFDNNKALVDQGFISRTALDTSLASLQAAQANHKAALAALDVSKKAVQDAALRTPISGVVAQRLAQPGERVGIDARVLEIVDLSRLELEAQLAASDSVQVKLGQTARLKVEGLDEAIVATVTRINPSATAGSRSVLVYLAIAPAPGLRQGLFAQGRLETARESILAAPLSAVRTDKPEPYLQLVKDGRIVHQSVAIGVRGQAQEQTMVAVSNVAVGDVLTRSSAGNLREGTKVNIAKSISQVTATAATTATNPANASSK